MKVPKLQIGQFEFKGIVQGGMGVDVSDLPVPALFAEAGFLGTMTSIKALPVDRANRADFVRFSTEALAGQIKLCRSLTDKPVAVNVMGAMDNVDELIDTAIYNGIKIIVYGAGIPGNLPKKYPDPSLNFIPIISSARLAGNILARWLPRAPAAFIVSGTKSGGHSAFQPEQLNQPENFFLGKLVQEVLAVVRPYELILKRKIPVIAAGGVYSGADAAYMYSIGASAVQLGTRFVVVDENPVSSVFKEVYIRAREEDMRIIKSPVGMWLRVIQTPLLDKIAARQVRMNCPFHCISRCDIKNAGYCIAQALLNAAEGEDRKSVV